ncbi:DUF2284 domain-containing protein [Chloroflexota bacterium]
MINISPETVRLARELGIDEIRELPPGLLVPEERIREFCRENRCGSFQGNYMCPPRVGSLPEIRARLRAYSRGILLQYAQPVDVQHDHDAVRRTKVAFHRKVLHLEDLLKEAGSTNVWGLIGGSCDLCQACAARLEQPCPYPDQARTSLEALGIDVLSLLDGLGLDNHFHPRQIRWTGALLY